MVFIDLGVHIVLVDEFLGDEFARYTHVLISFHRGLEVKVFDICAEIFSVWGRKYAVPEHLGCYEVSCSGGDISRVIDEISSYGNTDSVGVSFLGSVIDQPATLP